MIDPQKQVKGVKSFNFTYTLFSKGWSIKGREVNKYFTFEATDGNSQSSPVL